MSSITETLFDPLFATNISPLPESYATPRGLEPTEIVATTVLVVSSITETVNVPLFVTNISPLAESYATPRPWEPTEIGEPTTVLVVSSITETVLSL